MANTSASPEELYELEMVAARIFLQLRHTRRFRDRKRYKALQVEFKQALLAFLAAGGTIPSER